MRIDRSSWAATRRAPSCGVAASYRELITMMGGASCTRSRRCGLLAGTGGLIHRLAMPYEVLRTSGATAHDRARSACASAKDDVRFTLSAHWMKIGNGVSSAGLAPVLLDTGAGPASRAISAATAGRFGWVSGETSR